MYFSTSINKINTHIMHIKGPIQSSSTHTNSQCGAQACVSKGGGVYFTMCCDLSSWIATTMPLGMWVTRTALLVVFTDWPPAPPERYVSMRRSSFRTTTSTWGDWNNESLLIITNYNTYHKLWWIVKKCDRLWRVAENYNELWQIVTDSDDVWRMMSNHGIATLCTNSNELERILANKKTNWFYTDHDEWQRIIINSKGDPRYKRGGG